MKLFYLLHVWFILFITLFICNGLSAQYILQIDSNATYSDITNPTYEIPDNSPYFGNVNTKPVMQFKAFAQTYDLSQNVFIPIKQGYCYFDNGTRSTTIYACDGSFAKRPGHTSVFSFKTETSGSEKIFIMQWKNMGVENGHDSDYLNFQICLYETSGNIEFRYGDSKLRNGLFNSGANGPSVGLLEMDASFTNIFGQIWLKGNPANPQIFKTYALYTLDKLPKPGTVYRFVNQQSDVHFKRVNNITVSLYPQPASESLTLAVNGTGVEKAEVYSLEGKLLFDVILNENQSTLDISVIEPGTYLILFKDSKGALVQSRKFLKS